MRWFSYSDFHTVRSSQVSNKALGHLITQQRKLEMRPSGARDGPKANWPSSCGLPALEKRPDIIISAMGEPWNPHGYLGSKRTALAGKTWPVEVLVELAPSSPTLAEHTRYLGTYIGNNEALAWAHLGLKFRRLHSNTQSSPSSSPDISIIVIIGRAFHRGRRFMVTRLQSYQPACGGAAARGCTTAAR